MRELAAPTGPQPQENMGGLESFKCVKSHHSPGLHLPQNHLATERLQYSCLVNVCLGCTAPPSLGSDRGLIVFDWLCVHGCLPWQCQNGRSHAGRSGVSHHKGNDAGKVYRVHRHEPRRQVLDNGKVSVDACFFFFSLCLNFFKFSALLRQSHSRLWF